MRLLFLFSLLFIPIAIRAQEKTATIYIYAPRHVKTMGKVAPPLYIDDALVAKIDGERYVVVKLPAGKHSLRSKNAKDGGVEMEFVSGHEYYMRLEIENAGFFLAHPRISYVPIEQGQYDIKHARLADPGDVKNFDLVTEPKPKEKKSSHAAHAPRISQRWLEPSPAHAGRF